MGFSRQTATPRVSKPAQDACRYPTLIKTRKATTKRWDIMSAAALPSEKPKWLPHPVFPKLPTKRRAVRL